MASNSLLGDDLEFLIQVSPPPKGWDYSPITLGIAADTESHRTQGISRCLPGMVLIPRPRSVAMATAKLLLPRLATLRAEGNAFTPDRAASCEFLRPSISQAGPDGLPRKL